MSPAITVIRFSVLYIRDTTVHSNIVHLQFISVVGELHGVDSGSNLEFLGGWGTPEEPL